MRGTGKRKRQRRMPGIGHYLYALESSLFADAFQGALPSSASRGNMERKANKEGKEEEEEDRRPVFPCSPIAFAPWARL